ncbi:transglutaminase domain-containing protein [Roseburia hominis]
MRRRRRAGCLPICLVVLCIGLGVGCIGAGIMKEKGEPLHLVQEKVQKVAQQKIPYQEVSIAEAELEGRFYYGFLNEEEKLAYRELLTGLRENREEIYLHHGEAERVNTIFQNVLNDNPELFWCDGRGTTTTYSGGFGQESYIKLEPDYVYSGSKKEQMLTEIEAAAEEFLTKVPGDASEYEKIRMVYEYLIQMVDYQTDAPDNQNIYSALVGHASVCAGYARSTQYLLEKLGIFCAYVTGTTVGTDGNSTNHAWNLVRCDGSYYFVDTTWGDPVFCGEVSEGQERNITYDFLCCSGRELFRTHTLDEGYEYPECAKEDLNYYRRNGMYEESFDQERIRERLYNTIDAGERDSVFKFADEEVYEQAHNTLLKELVRDAAAYLGRRYGLSEVEYSYSEDPLLCKIIIFWKYE